METFIVGKWSKGLWEKWEHVLPLMIDFIVKVSKNQVILRINDEAKKVFRRCC